MTSVRSSAGVGRPVVAGLLLGWATLGASGAPVAPVQAVETHADHLRALDFRRRATLTRFVNQVIDPEEVSARLLGPHRPAFTAEQRQEFARLFVALLVARAWQRADALNSFTNSCALEKGSVVRCELRSGQETVRAYFTVSGTRIVDARVGGVALIKENRGAIDRLIRTRGVEALLERMRRRVAELESKGPARRR